MIKNQKLSVFFGGLLLLACGVASAHAQPAPRRGAATTRTGGDYVAKPVEAKAEDAKPVETKRVETERVEAQPVEKPVDANPEPTVSELRCRGGENAFQLNGGTEVWGRDRKPHYIYRLDFREGSGPARGDGSGLEEGTCSWIDRALWAAEPRQVFFDGVPVLRDIGARQGELTKGTTALSQYFDDQGHFWSFFVYDTGDGTFQATRLKVLLDARKVGVDERLRRPWRP